MALKQEFLFEPYPLCFSIPTVQEMNISIIPRLWFVKHVTLNAEELSADIYESVLNSRNYRSFIYAFAYEIGITDPSDPLSCQLESNARMLKLALRKNLIHLSYVEEEVLNISLFFTHWWLSESMRKERSELLMQNLFHEYGGFLG